LRWPHSLADSFNLWGLAALLLAGFILWAVSSIPFNQTVEGTVETRALSFQLRPSNEIVAADQPTGFFAVDVRSLVISGLRDGTPASFRLKGTPLRVDAGEEVTFTPPATETFEVKLQLPPGTSVENLHGEDSQELVVDLRSPIGSTPSTSRAIDLSITPPAPLADSEVQSAQGEPVRSRRALMAVQKPAAGSERILPTPDGTFSILLHGDARLRLRLANPSLVFEPNLPVREVKFSSVKASVFGGANLHLSDVRNGTLHFGRREPLQLREKQFLKMEGPGILEMSDMRLENNQLIVFVSGHINHLRAGLSPNRPSTELKGTLLSRHLSPEQISGFYGFMGGVIGTMLVVFFRAY
jgi:hypothetical protein